jgi:hypothetical protein
MHDLRTQLDRIAANGSSIFDEAAKEIVQIVSRTRDHDPFRHRYSVVAVVLVGRRCRRRCGNAQHLSKVDWSRLLLPGPSLKTSAT